jgi:lysophospholipase L1-like esterase
LFLKTAALHSVAMKSTELSRHNHLRTPIPVKWTVRLSVIGALFAVLLAVPLLNVQPSADQVNWANPSAATIKSIAQKIDANNTDQPSYLSNLDCVQYTYRYQGSNNMQNGCFTTAAFGSMDVNSHATIFNSTDEAVRVEPSGSGFVLPLPHSAVVADLTPASLAGSYLNFYTYFPNVLSDVWDYPHVHVSYKQITGEPNLHFIDQTGQQLPVNAQSMAFSTNGAWMVVESPWHSFMRVNLATFEIVPFAPSFNGWSFDTQMHTSQVNISDDGRYAAIQSDESSSFKVYDLTTCSGKVASDLKPLSCASHDYQQALYDSVPGYSHTTKVRFLNDSLLSINAAYNEGVGATALPAVDTLLLSPSGQIGSLINYLALGDSYTAGEGSFNYKPGTDLPFNRCHLSAHSYPLLLSTDIFHGDGHSVACSGARVHDLDDATGGYPGQVEGGLARKTRSDDSIQAIINEYNPGYIAQYEFAQHYQPKVLTVSVGGNDMGFADILKNCAVISIHASTCYDSYEARQEVIGTINSQLKPLINLYTSLQSESPLSRIYAIGYPQVVSGGGSCALNVHLDAKEIEFSQEVIGYMNSIIEQAATAVGIPYIDISQALYGHRLCEAKSYDVAVNGLTAGTDDGPWGTKVFGSESYHPTQLGQELIEQTILTNTKNFTRPLKTPNLGKTVITTLAGNTPILVAPKTGKAIHTVISGKDITDAEVSRGKKTTIKVSGTTSGFKPSSSGAITVGGVGVGNFTTDTDGNVQQEVTIPPSTSPGYQPVTVTGQGNDDKPVDVTEPIYIGSSDTDTDGDGIPDKNDSCPGVINSRHDQDADGIDDACDGIIGPAAPSGGTTSSGGMSNSGGPITPPTPTQDASSAQPGLQGDTTIPVDTANAVNDPSTEANTGMLDGMDDLIVANFNMVPGNGFSSEGIGFVPQINQPVAKFSQVPKTNLLIQPGKLPQAKVPCRPLANIGSVISNPFRFNYLERWWWALLIFICLVLFVSYLFGKRRMRENLRSLRSGGRSSVYGNIAQIPVAVPVLDQAVNHSLADPSKARKTVQVLHDYRVIDIVR